MLLQTCHSLSHIRNRDPSISISQYDCVCSLCLVQHHTSVTVAFKAGTGCDEGSPGKVYEFTFCTKSYITHSVYMHML